MARRKKGIEDSEKSIIETAKARLDYVDEVWEDQRNASKSDLEFLVPGNQWDQDTKGSRLEEGRPCLEVDKLTPFINQIVNEQRQNRPQPQCNPVGDGATRETAEILQGMIRHITYISDGDVAIDTAYESMVRCGIGYSRVLTDYIDETSFDQEIKISRIVDPFCVYLDPSCSDPVCSDAEWGAIVTWVSKEAYKKEYPDSKMASAEAQMWSQLGEVAPKWASRDGKGVRVVEYFEKSRKSVKIYELPDGTTSETLPEGVEAVRERMVYKPVVKWYKLNAIEVLQETEWPGKYIPIVPVYGNELYLDGKMMYSGLVRTAKDPAKFYNFWKTTQAELISMAPKAPWIVPKGAMVNPKAWQASNRRPVVALEYEYADDRGNPIPTPQRIFGEPPIQAVDAAMLGAEADIKAVTGMYDPVRGINEGGQSGVAIRQLQRQGQSVNYHYSDNLARSVRHLGRILIDLIPKIYDTQRMVRIVKPDQSEELVTVNGPHKGEDGIMRIFDLSVGRYDVTVSVGPSYQTKRQENLALLESMLQGPLGQLIAQIAPDQVFAMMDFEIAKTMQERAKKILPPQVQDNAEAQIPPQVQAQMQQMQMLLQQAQQQIMEQEQQLKSKEADIAVKMQGIQANSVIEQMRAALEAEKLDIERQKLLLDAQKLNIEAEKIRYEAMRSSQTQPEGSAINEE